MTNCLFFLGVYLPAIAIAQARQAGPRLKIKRPSIIGGPFNSTLCAWRYALLFLQCHLNVTAGTLFGAKTAPFAEIQVEFVQPRFL